MSKKTYLGRLAGEADKLFAGRSIEQYGAICYRRSQGRENVEILLITSRESGRWVIPRGWPMDKKLPHQVAEREAWEEAGVRGKARKKRFGYYTYLKVLGTGETVPSIVQVHLLEVAELADRFPERGQRQLQWFSPNEAAAQVREPELKSLLRRVEAALAPDK
ncbi:MULTISPECIES: NUDIX hydrolase [Rhizobium]|uniref:DNA mismatch repair protein MutT n=1 Tax=Rhizobium tropici TaxID=398 RepID=A0A329Y2J1_RHITR|nr:MULTISPECIES: NUDIX hydrolase [Rhizobium]MBB3286907.1 8-oxo-dGTP pyrophosphatase MutT (NUDIX family) [Rhizobium sp. BK252]MBB3401647.1 8-oxo-dGTP pyrophosphatase MutT (NUDIX family) [Rhizobium sp. BK289]MBB3414409.1 8-oxo-dGTP pyrophosphatase MutT (NUDIX family) [Rhizobium sp. BK284]MBB3482297.1 8-oxo-dGTP pyrophosphatase MutT (NUDIX family) [Rhizobium sp. BK347]MDK4718402.1 NUDIX hydrolase [Rhizobium sp. CNPSo 3968]